MKLAALLLLSAGSLFPASRLEQFVLILEEKPVAERMTSRKDLHNAAAVDARQKILRDQQTLTAALAERDIRVFSSNQTLVNAVFVEASGITAAELATLPGVRYAERLLPMKLHLMRALELQRVTQAWSQVNGPQNAGAGIRIAVLDTGIDTSHPGLQGGTLNYPQGFPKCLQDRGDCAYTNPKVIVARSYVSMLVGTQPEETRPDDLSPRDRVGHGTAVAMIAAGLRNTGPAGEIQGVAPGAYLGNYKIFGSPGVNGPFTNAAALVQAIEDAVSDGMDIANVSLGSPAVWGPNDRGGTCSEQGNTPCDWRAAAIDNASTLGLTVVVSAGNDGEFGLRTDVPAFNSIHTPGTAPSAITVGATTNSHVLYQAVRIEGPNLPANLRTLNTRFGNGPMPAGPVSGPLIDVTRLGDNGRACSPLGDGTLNGAIALIQRGDCQTTTKINNAYRAGAIGVILYQQTAEGIFPMRGLDGTSIPSVLIGARLGSALKTYASQNPSARATIDPALTSVDSRSDADVITTWSSRGPSIGENAMKPELVAVGTDIYTATQRYDPNGEMYDATGYTAVQGTSFAAPMVAGAAALVKQRNPRMTPAQIKSAVVNTATLEVSDIDGNGQLIQASLLDIGAGRLNADNAVRTNVTAEPATLSFGVWGNAVPGPRTLNIRNHGTANLQIRTSVIRGNRNDPVSVVVTPTEATVRPGEGVQLSVRLNGNRPQPSAAEGYIQIDGGAAPIRIPYAYFVPDGILHNIVPLRGDGFADAAGREVSLMFKAIDRFGIPVANLPTRFSTTLGNGRIVEESRTTDDLGIGYAWAELGSQLGEQEFLVRVGNDPALEFPFWGRVWLRPNISTGGVVNAASGTGGPFAPGSYISLFGRGLGEVTRAFGTPYLPLAIAGTSVSFDVPGQNLSVPGRLTFVSDGQVNVQIPWELQGASSALLKVSIGDSSGNVVTVPLGPASPALFEYADAGRQLAAALDVNFRVVSSANPIARGGVLQLYANGLGNVENRPASGEIAPSNPLATTLNAPTVTIGGRPAPVSFSGLAPGFVGLYQINVTVPQDAPTGLQPVVITTSGIASKPVNVPVQ